MWRAQAKTFSVLGVFPSQQQLHGLVWFLQVIHGNLAKAISLGKKPFVTPQKGRVGVGFVEEEKKKENFMKDARAPLAKKIPQAKKVNIARYHKGQNH